MAMSDSQTHSLAIRKAEGNRINEKDSSPIPVSYKLRFIDYTGRGRQVRRPSQSAAFTACSVDTFRAGN
jgi:hypothetical protein